MTWLYCVDHNKAGEDYPLNAANVICFKRRDGWWRAWDVNGGQHQVRSADDAKVEALIGGRP